MPMVCETVAAGLAGLGVVIGWAAVIETAAASNSTNTDFSGSNVFMVLSLRIIYFFNLSGAKTLEENIQKEFLMAGSQVSVVMADSIDQHIKQKHITQIG